MGLSGTGVLQCLRSLRKLVHWSKPAPAARKGNKPGPEPGLRHLKDSKASWSLVSLVIVSTAQFFLAVRHLLRLHRRRRHFNLLFRVHFQPAIFKSVCLLCGTFGTWHAVCKRSERPRCHSDRSDSICAAPSIFNLQVFTIFVSHFHFICGFYQAQVRFNLPISSS